MPCSRGKSLKVTETVSSNSESSPLKVIPASLSMSLATRIRDSSLRSTEIRPCWMVTVPAPQQRGASRNQLTAKTMDTLTCVMADLSKKTALCFVAAILANAEIIIAPYALTGSMKSVRIGNHRKRKARGMSRGRGEDLGGSKENTIGRRMR